jgi:hypothetical protein
MNDLGLHASHGSHVFAGSGVWRSLRDVPNLDELEHELQDPNPEWLDWMGYSESYCVGNLFDALEKLKPASATGITHCGYPTNTQSSFNQLRVGAEAAICTGDWRGAVDLLAQAAQMRPQHRGVARRLAAVSCRNPLLRRVGLILSYRDLG